MKHLKTSLVYNELKSIKSILKTEKTELLNLNQAAELLHLKPSYIYQLVHFRKIPFYKPGKRVYFHKNELIDWILNSKIKTNAEIEEEYNEKKGKKNLSLTSN